ncbi:hypothetical protein PR048_017899 [Dryococelus australis]|uniref:PiggyBac transposable element-derived protein domain-containing protein n=1 Tax=Dryococelus australis TaxID=614101 RepID=A0ABQ9HAW6_9NEOP|nr:hypothetical protein PR048_017899 [Dryococelus australis]
MDDLDKDPNYDMSSSESDLSFGDFSTPSDETGVKKTSCSTLCTNDSPEEFRTPHDIATTSAASATEQSPVQHDIVADSWGSDSVATPSENHEKVANGLSETIAGEQTNLYANPELKQSDIPANSRMNMWVPMNKQEILQFLGIIAFMSIVKEPSISDYWTSETVCIDENIVPFKGRLIMKQYCPQKTHKNGVKIFKVCFRKGYTWKIKIHSGKQQDADNSLPTSLVLKLCDALLYLGHIIVTDNYYTSMDLAEKLLDQSTDFLGNLRSNKKKIQKQLSARNSKRVKWLLNKITDPLENRIVIKPKAIIDYNRGKAAIDLSHQLSSYSTSLRRSLKLYHKVVIELLLGTIVVNADIIYCQVTGKKTTFTNFWKALVKQMMTLNVVPELQDKHEMPAPQTKPTVHTKMMFKHIFRKMEGSAREGRMPWWTQYKAKCDARAAIWLQRHVLYNSAERTPMSPMALWDILGTDTGVRHGS